MRRETQFSMKLRSLIHLYGHHTVRVENGPVGILPDIYVMDATPSGDQFWIETKQGQFYRETNWGLNSGQKIEFKKMANFRVMVLVVYYDTKNFVIKVGRVTKSGEVSLIYEHELLANVVIEGLGLVDVNKGDRLSRV